MPRPAFHKYRRQRKDAKNIIYYRFVRVWPFRHMVRAKRRANTLQRQAQEGEKMTKAEAIELLVNATYSEEWQGNEKLTKAQHMAIEELEQDKVLCFDDLENKCKHCTVKGETKHYCYCDIWGSVVNPRGWCNYGERDEIEQDEEQAAIEQLEHDLKYEPTFSNEDGSM